MTVPWTTFICLTCLNVVTKTNALYITNTKPRVPSNNLQLRKTLNIIIIKILTKVLQPVHKYVPAGARKQK